MAEVFLDADQLRAATFVRHVELHATLGSTNDRAAELLRDANIELPALVAARLQTAGRGRGQHQWWSTDGALTFSLLLDSAAIGISTQSWPQLSLTTAAAICDALEVELQRAGSSSTPVDAAAGPLRTTVEAQLAIKPPNDVLIDGRKVCGILIESPSGSAQSRNRLIVGIGINVNNSCRTAPHDIRSQATALCDVTGARHDLQTVLVHALQAINERFGKLAAAE